MPKQKTPTEPPTGYRIYAGGQPWVLVAVCHDLKSGYAFCERHRKLHPKCPLKSKTFVDVLGTDDWTILD